LFILFYKKPLLAPASAIVGCNQEPIFFGEVIPAQSGYNNCAVDSIAKISSEKSEIGADYLRDQIINCMNKKDIDVINNGIDVNRQLKDLINCKDSIINGGRSNVPKIASSGISPFKGDCPQVGSNIVLMGGGHSVECSVISCDPKIGKAQLFCQESIFKEPIEEAGWAYNMDIESNGIIRVPKTTIDGKSALLWFGK
jgi:hypothetical protein